MSTTGGWDLVVQLPEGTMRQILVGLYVEDYIPHEFTRAFANFGMTGDADVRVDWPTLRLDASDAANPNQVELILPMWAHVRLDAPPAGFGTSFQVEGTLSAVTTLIQESLQANGNRIDYVEIRLADLPVDRYDLKISVPGFDAYIPLIVAIFRDELKDRSISLPLTPTIPSEIGGLQPAGYDLQIYNDPTPKDIDCISILVPGNGGASPSATLVKPFVNRDDGFGVAISKKLFDSVVAEAIHGTFGDLPANLPNDGSVEIRELGLALADGHIRVWGRGKKRIDCWPDAAFSFSGKVYLTINWKGDLEVSTKDIGVDVPWWIDMLHFILPGIGSVIVDVAKSAARSAVRSAVSNQSGSLFQDFTLFGDSVPSTVATVSQAPRVRIRNQVISIRPDALILKGRLIVLLGEDEGQFVGNKRSREVHRQGACAYSKLIAPSNRRFFYKVSDALWLGYNGCWYCLREYDTDQFRGDG